MITYCFTDVHGEFELMERAWEWIAKDGNGEDHVRIITLGDYIDRGPNSRQVLQSLMEAKAACDRTNVPENKFARTELIVLKGNHDDMMVKALRYRSKLHEETWLNNGGIETLRNYAIGGYLQPGVGMVPDKLDRYALNEHMDFIESMPLWYEDEHRIYVHAGLPAYAGSYAHPSENATGRNAEVMEEAMLWTRCSPSKDDYSGSPKMVVHGHTPVSQPTLVLNSLFLDTGACQSRGTLTIAKFVDDPDRPWRQSPTFHSIRKEVQPVALKEHV